VLQRRQGKGNALAAGFARVTGDIVVMFDADGSADPDEIARFVDALKAGADFAKGSRFTAGGGSTDITAIRSIGNKFLSGVVNLGFRTRYSDLCYGYNAFWADLVPLLDLPDHAAPAPANGTMLWGDGFEIETVINCRFAAAQVAITEVPSVEKLRMFGESNLNAVSDGLRVLKTLVTEWRRSRSVRRMERRLAQPSVARPVKGSKIAA
jgi:glycosyltransferase involved in cell wall biosynthesis